MLVLFFSFVSGVSHECSSYDGVPRTETAPGGSVCASCSPLSCSRGSSRAQSTTLCINPNTRTRATGTHTVIPFLLSKPPPQTTPTTAVQHVCTDSFTTNSRRAVNLVDCTPLMSRAPYYLCLPNYTGLSTVHHEEHLFPLLSSLLLFLVHPLPTHYRQSTIAKPVRDPVIFFLTSCSLCFSAPFVLIEFPFCPSQPSHS